jgi:hypothetical protein
MATDKTHLDLPADKLRELGYTIDTTCYPWYAYLGPRFNPSSGFRCTTPAWPNDEDI